MDFIDEVTFQASGGRGGNGCVSFRREKFVPKGGPDGGDGGHGGTVVLHVQQGLNTLIDIRHRRRYKAGNGENGKGKKKHGKNGKSVIIPVPQGTMVFNSNTGSVFGDLTKSAQELTIAKGGRGGRGNARFATPTRQAPDFAKNGSAGEDVNIRLELKLLADVGLVGLPNAGKSTLLSKISSARPKIANYPFTTLIPNLGIVYYKSFQSFVVADIPGLIKGAHSGKGLGDRFLKHIERTRVLIFIIETSEKEIAPVYRTLIKELTLYSTSLLAKPCCIALSKVDLLSREDRSILPSTISGKLCIPVSAVTGEGIQSLMDEAFRKLSEVDDE
jgi:GTP-binding protein